jgi:hypothetical protein
MQMVRSEVDYTQQLCDTCSKELAREFKDWWVFFWVGLVLECQLVTEQD